MILMPALLGCVEKSAPKTLVVHSHDGVYDLIDHQDQVVHISKDIADLKTAIMKPKIQTLIINGRVIMRCKGVSDGNGLTLTDAAVEGIGAMADVGINRHEFDYTNN